MTTAPDRAPLPRRRLLPLTVFIAAAVALLAFAGTAAAETKIGEGTSPEQLGLRGEADLVKAAASFDSTAGSATIEITTREAPETTAEEERPPVLYIGALLHVDFSCSRAAFEAVEEEENEEAPSFPAFPTLETFSANNQLILPPESGLPASQAFALYAASAKESTTPEPKNLFAASKTTSGATATIIATTPRAVGAPFNCADVAAEGFGDPDVIVFPLTTKPEPPPAQTVTPPATQSAPAPAPAPPPTGVLSIAKAKKPLKLKVGRWTTVKVNVANTGGTATAPGSLQLKTTKGVVVKPGRQKLPALLPGGSWTVTYKVKLTAKAKKSSTLALVGSAATLSAKSSLVLKLAGG